MLELDRFLKRVEQIDALRGGLNGVDEFPADSNHRNLVTRFVMCWNM